MAKNRTYGTTWWGNQWLKALSDIDYSNRIPRGRSYASSGYVFDLQLKESKGQISAKVEGKSFPFYKVTLKFTQVSQEAKEAFMSDLVKDMSIVSKLTNRQLDPSLMDLALKHHIKLFPSSWMDLGMNCNCPDFAVPCKHIAAVIYVVSEIIDSNPFILFTLRGIDLLKEIEAKGFNLDEAVQVETVSVAKLHQDATTSIQQIFAQSLLYKVPLEPVVIQRLVDLKQDPDFAQDSYLNPVNLMDVEREGSVYLRQHLKDFEREIKELPSSWLSEITGASQKAQSSAYATASVNDEGSDTQELSNSSRGMTGSGTENSALGTLPSDEFAVTPKDSVTSKYARKYVRNNQAASVPFSEDLQAKASKMANQEHAKSKYRANAADFEANMMKLEQQFEKSNTSLVQKRAYVNLHVTKVSAENIQTKQAIKETSAKLHSQSASLESAQGNKYSSFDSVTGFTSSQSNNSEFKTSQSYENDLSNSVSYESEAYPLDFDEGVFDLLDFDASNLDAIDLDSSKFTSSYAQQSDSISSIAQDRDNLLKKVPHWQQQMARLNVSHNAMNSPQTAASSNTSFQYFMQQKYGQTVFCANSSRISIDELKQAVLNQKQHGKTAANMKKVAASYSMSNDKMESLQHKTEQVKFNQGSEHQVFSKTAISLSNTVNSSVTAQDLSNLAQKLSGAMHLCEVIGQIIDADYEFAHRKKKPGRKSQADIEQGQKIEQAITKYGSYNVYLALEAISKQTGVEVFGADDKFELIKPSPARVKQDISKATQGQRIYNTRKA